MSNLEPFLKKYRQAVAGNSKEMRISMTEAAGIVAAFTEIQASLDSLKAIEKKLDSISKEIKDVSTKSDSIELSSDGWVDGGGFK